MKKNNIFAATFLLLFAFSQIAPTVFGADRLTFGLHADELASGEAWKEEFTEISSKAVVSMTLPTEELQALVERCDKLLPVIEGLEDTPRKIYLKRLNKTKSLFDFVIESRKEAPAQ